MDIFPPISRERRGKIQLILGPMFSGKTSELCRRYRRNVIAGLRCLLIKYNGDVRYSTGHVTTHDRISIPACSCSALFTLPINPVDYDTVFIDEIQFYPDKYEFCETMAQAGVDVVACGLSSNWERKPFPDMGLLQAVAFSIETLLAVCGMCKKEEACFNLRLSDETNEIVIGGSDKYRAVCRNCYFCDKVGK